MAHSKLLLSIHSSHHSVKAIERQSDSQSKKSSDVQELNAATSSFNYDLVLICPKCCYCHLAR